MTLHRVGHGDGMPLVALHGAGVDHRELEGALEPLLAPLGLRRIYVDLPGMGRSTADGLDSNDDVVDALAEFVASLNSGPVLLLGHSYGAYLARGVAGRHPDAVAGLALLCPVGDGSAPVPAHEVVREDADAHDELDRALWDGFDEYFVVRTAETARRYRERTVPGIELVDQVAFGRLAENWRLDLRGRVYPGPVVIVAGRGDATAGFEGPVALGEEYPDAVVTVVDKAGHALMHERPDAIGVVLRDWVERARGRGRRAR